MTSNSPATRSFGRPRPEGDKSHMATAEQYERVLVKAESIGLGSLNKQELDLLKTLYKESGGRGNRARRVLDGK
jgi:hypothetical protein